MLVGLAVEGPRIVAPRRRVQILLPQHLDVPAQRHGSHHVLGLVGSCTPRPQGATESHGEPQYLDPEPFGNDEMAELVVKYPDRFVAALTSLAMNNMDAALEETDRTIRDLKFRGVYLHTPVDEKPLDNPEFLPLYEKMAEYDLPIVIHPMRKVSHPDYLTEKESKYNMFSLFGWPYDTTSAMARLVFSGIMEKYPNLKVVTHHCGGMVPFYGERIKQFTQLFYSRRAGDAEPFFRKDIVDYFRMFYADTAIYGNPKALECGHAFFGPDRILFGIDFPLGDTEHGDRNYRQTINAIEQMDITEEDKKKIYEDNARKLMRLPV